MSTEIIQINPDLGLFCQVDNFSDPWVEVPTIIMVHGFAESSLAWYAWVPLLAKNYRVIRFDMRGFGQSTPMLEEYTWTMDSLLEDISAVALHFNVDRFHLIGAKSGGSLVLQYAAQNPEKVISIISITPPVVGAKAVPDWLRQIQEEGVKNWARSTMPGRLGSLASEQEITWWVDHVQGLTPKSTLIGYLQWVPKLDLREEVLRVRCPCLIISTSGNGLRTVESVKEWQTQMQQSSLLVIDGDAWHAAAAYPEQCAIAAKQFLEQ